MKKRYLLICFIFLNGILWGQRGKNGPLTVSSTVTVNEYTVLKTNAAVGNTSITVTNSGLNTHNRFSSSLSGGDLVMIIQMQGATIKGHDSVGNPTIGSPNDSTWGNILNYNNCGNYEFRQVESVPNDTTIIICRPLINNYTASGKVQVVRIPRYTSLTVNNGGSISCDLWDSATGGVIATEVEDNTIINAGGTINASGSGFRGGQLVNMNNANYSSYNFSTSTQKAGERGEGIAGYQAGYNVYGGMYGRGAAANAGGGGDAWNCAGGGGGNGGNIAGYNSNGNPDTSNRSWVAAWNLEYPNFAKNVSSGGGRGGYGTGDNGPNPLALGPSTPQWGSWLRLNGGGKGGRPLDYSTGRLFLGGGGGAGHEDDNNGGAGGNGGGMIYLVSYGTVSGGGQILSNGANGGNNNAAPDGDGTGGGGAGGTIIINSTGNISGITLEANGGTGGSQFLASQTENEGGGGGGGGGYIATTNSITTSVSGGANGTTNASSMTAFIPDGATKGGTGTVINTLSPLNYNYSCCSLITLNISASKDTICPDDTTTISVTSIGSNTVKYSWSPGGQTNNTIHVHTNSTTTYYVSVNDSVNIGCALRDSITINIMSASNTIFSGDTGVCKGQAATLSFSGGISYKWSNGATTSFIQVNDTATTTYTVAIYGKCDSINKNITVTIFQPPTPNITGDDSVCAGLTDTIVVSGGNSYLWSNGTTKNTYNTGEIKSDSIIFVTVRNSRGCAVRDSFKIKARKLPVVSFPDPHFSVCLGQCISLEAFTQDSTVTYIWSTGSTTNNIIFCPDKDSSFSLTVSNGCKSSYTFPALVYFPSLFVCCDTTINNGGNAILTANSALRYKWVPDIALSCDTCSNVIATPTVTTTYTVTGINVHGCIDTMLVTVKVDKVCFDFKVPNVFTPNGDGINDRFVIQTTDLDSYNIVIYDRWGKEMYKSTDPSQSWNGDTENGNQTCDGVYYYIITATCQGKDYKKNGFVQLIR